MIAHNRNNINSRFHRFSSIYYYYINNVVFDLYTHLELEIRCNILTLCADMSNKQHQQT
jgi:hypothetical protein